MFGVVCLDPSTGCDVPYTIAGPTDGSTNIVHHDGNNEFEIATALCDQYGAGYLGITCDCKATYNPSTGTMTAEHFNGVASKVDINVNSDTDCAQSFLVQGTVTESGVTSNSNTLEKTNVCYNANCYVCNDPVTGDPVCKPTVHIPTLCVDELLGYNDGLPRRTNVCEDCWRQIPFIGEDNGEETLDTTWACDAFIHNSCTCTTRMEHLELTDICRPGDIYIGDKVFNPNLFDYYTKDPTNTFNTRQAGFASMSNGFSICDVDVTTCCAKYKLSLNENNSAIETNALTVSPTSCPTLSLTLTGLPYTCNAENISYTPMVVNATYGYVKKMDGFSYDPATCYLCGNFCGNINIWPYECCNSSCSASNYQGVKLYNNGCSGFNIEYMCCISSMLTCNPALCVDYLGARLNNNNSTIAAMNGYACINSAYSVDNYARISVDGSSGICICANTRPITLSAGGNITLVTNCVINTCANYNNFYACSHSQCTRIFNDANSFYVDYWDCAGCYNTRQRFDCNSRKLQQWTCERNTWEDYALMCDIASAGGRGQITTPSTLSCLFTALGDINGTPTHINDSNISFTAMDYLGNTIAVCHLLGFITRPETTMAQFVGIAAATNNKKYHLDMWFDCTGAVQCDWTLITPVPGTLYGCASDTTVNVLGNL